MRKRRPREHIIADLSRHHVERFVLRCGYTIERFTHDYGIDLGIYTYGEDGEIENGVIGVQLKATERIRWLRSGDAFSFRLDTRDVNYWRGELTPVLLIVYDVTEDKAYWLHIQEHFRAVAIPDGQASITVNIPRSNAVDEEMVRRFRLLKQEAMSQAQRGA
jgi:hypothetical protein